MLKPYEAITDELDRAQKLNEVVQHALVILNPDRGYYMPLNRIVEVYHMLHTASGMYEQAHDTREAVERAETP